MVEARLFFLITGASGMGKSTVRRQAIRRLGHEFECLELGHVSAVPAVPDLRWRQQAAEAAVQRAIALQPHGRHLLLAGDPVAAGEILAAPSATVLDGIAICLLDAREEVQAARLTARGDDPVHLPAHVSFAAWMRAHARDPGHMPHVITSGGWEEMRWERWMRLASGDGSWGMTVVDTSDLTPEQVGARIVAWCENALARRVPVFREGWWRADPGSEPSDQSEQGVAEQEQ